MRNAPQLITYADRLAGDLAGVARFLRRPEVDGAFGGVHVLPFFDPIDGSDAGFDPVDHTAVDHRIGSWDDIADLGTTHEVMADMIVNHVAATSAPVDAWRADPAGNDIVLTLDGVFPDGATEADLTAIYRPRPGLPFTPVRTDDGTRRLAWTTFTSNQIDIDVESAAGRAYLASILDRFETAGIRQIRLDAVGYAIKRPGTSCFMIPETFDFIDALSADARERGMEVLVEIHSHYRTQLAIADRVDRVYDFALPPLVLDAFATGDGMALRHWLDIRPANAVTVLDTHDGIGVIDIGAEKDRPGLVSPERLDALVEGIHRASDGGSLLATGAAASNLDLYQVNCTFFDAMGADPVAYESARLLQLLVPGVPQLYYVGLLAGRNDLDLLHRTGVGRDVNRHHYTADEVDDALATPLVRSILDHCRLRASHPAFSGACTVEDTAADTLVLRWDSGDDRVRAAFHLGSGEHELEHT